MNKLTIRVLSIVLNISIICTSLLQPFNGMQVYATELTESEESVTETASDENIVDESYLAESDIETASEYELLSTAEDSTESGQPDLSQEELIQDEVSLLGATPEGKISLEDCDIDVSLDANDQPVVRVSYNGLDLIEGQDYNCSLPSADKDDYYPIVAGRTDKAYIAVTGIGQYQGIVTVSCDLPVTALYALYVDSVSLYLQGNIGLNFYIDARKVLPLLESNRIYLLVGDNKYYLDEMDWRTSNSFVFSEYVFPKNIAEPVSFTAYIEGTDGARDQQLRIRKRTGIECENDTFSYSVADYLNGFYADSKYSNQFRMLTNALANYGAYADYYFNQHELDEIVYISDEVKADLAKYEKYTSGSLPQGVSYAGSTLTLDSDVVVRHYFRFDSSLEIEDFSFEVDGVYISPSSVANNFYYVELRGVPAPKLGTSYKLNIGQYGDTLWSLNYSALSYAYDVAKKGKSDELNALANSIYSYYKACTLYFDILEDMSNDERPDETVDITSNTSFSAVSGNTTAGRTVTGNNVAGMSANDLLNLAKTMLQNVDASSSYIHEASKWQYFTKAAQASGINSTHPLIGYDDETGNYIAIYAGYKSDDIYIYCGAMTADGKREGSNSIWLGESTSQYVEKDTGLTRYIATREYTVCDWYDDVAQGAFDTDYYINILTGAGDNIDIRRSYSGNLVNGYYDGLLSWTNQTLDSAVAEHYQAYFKLGYIVYDVLDGEGYTYITETTGGNGYEKIYSKKAYGLNGFDNLYTISGNYVRAGKYKEELTAPGMDIGNMNYYVSQNGNRVSGNSVSGESISYNHTYDTVSTNNTTKRYTEILATLAERIIADGQSFNIDDWSSMVEIAKNTGVTKTSPFKVMLADGTYAAIYLGNDENYYLYHGDMSNWKRSGQGSWITAKEIATSYSESKGSYGRYISITDGRWIDDRPNGAFNTTQITTVIKDNYNATISRVYSGKVVRGAYSGIVDWSVSTDISYLNSENDTHTLHKYAAKFNNGVIEGFNVDKEGYVYVPEISTGYSEDKLYYYKQYGYGGVAMDAAFNGKQRVITPVSGNNTGRVVSGNYVSANKSISENSTPEYSSIKTHYAISGNSVSSNVGQTILNSVTGNHYDTDGLIDMAYQLVTSKEVDAKLISLFNEECTRSGLTYENPVMAKYTDGYYVGIYGGYKDSDTIYIYYGSTNNYSRQGKGIWYSAKVYNVVYDAKTYECVSIDKTTAAWKNNLPQGNFTEELTVTCKGPDKDIKNVRTYSGKTKDGLFNGNINWSVVSDSVVDGERYANNSSYTAEYALGYIQYSYRDSEGYTLVESNNGGYHLDKVNTLKQYRVTGLKYEEWDDVWARYMVASQNRAGYSVSANSDAPTHKLTYAIDGKENPVYSSASQNKVELDAKDHSIFSVSGNTYTTATYATTDEMLLDYAYELATSEEVDFYSWNSFKAVIREKGLSNRSIQGIRDDGSLVAIYYDGYTATPYIYVGENYNWKRSGQGIWMTVYGGSDRYIDGEWESYYSVVDKTVCNWVNDVPDGEFTRTVKTVLKKGDIVSDSSKVYTGTLYNGAYNGIITWTDKNIYKNGSDVINSNHTYQAEFNCGRVLGAADNQGNVYIPSINGGYTECCLSANKLYTLPYLKYLHTVSGNSISANAAKEDPDKLAGLVAPIISTAKDVSGSLGSKVNIGVEVRNASDNMEYHLMKFVITNVRYNSGYWEDVAVSDTPDFDIVIDDEYKYRIRVYDRTTYKNYYSSTANVYVEDDMGEINRVYSKYFDNACHVYVEHTGYMRNVNVEEYMYVSYTDGRKGFEYNDVSYYFSKVGSSFADGRVTDEYVTKYSWNSTDLFDLRFRYQTKDGQSHVTDTYAVNRPYSDYFASGDMSKDANSQIEWRLSYDYQGNLILSVLGQGKMKDLAKSSDQPWRAYIPEGKSIYGIIIGDEITQIGTYAFADMGTVYIGTSDIFNCGISSIYTAYTYFDSSYGSPCYMPKSLELVADYSFANTAIANGYGSIAFTDKINAIRTCAFYNSAVSNITIASKDANIADDAFEGETSRNIVVKCPLDGSVYSWANTKDKISVNEISSDNLSCSINCRDYSSYNVSYECYPYMLYMYRNSTITYEVSWNDYNAISNDDVVFEVSYDGTNWFSLEDLVPANSYYYSFDNNNASPNYYIHGYRHSELLNITNPKAFDGLYLRANMHYSNNDNLESVCQYAVFCYY